MRKSLFIVAFFILVMSSECFAVKWQVVDAKTGAPIEGAVVLVEWTKHKRSGFKFKESYKVIEAVTDSDGRVKISKVLTPFVNPPDVTVYKKGYLGWNNSIIFTGFKLKKRTDFEWKNGYVFRLERFRDEYSHIKHVKFLRNSMSLLNLESKKKFYDAFAWERDMAQREREKQSKVKKPKRKVKRQ